MNQLICSSWKDFEPFEYILTSLPNELALPFPIPTLTLLSFKEIRLTYMKLTAETLENVLRSLPKIKGLFSLHLSLICYEITPNELSRLFCIYLPLFVNLRQLKWNFSTIAHFSGRNFEEIGLGLKFLNNLDNLVLLFSGRFLIFKPESFYKLFADFPKSVNSLSLKFLYQHQVSYDSLLALCEIIINTNLKNIELYVEKGLIEIYRAFGFHYKEGSLKSFQASSSIYDKICLSEENLDVFETFFKKFQGLEKFHFFCIFPSDLNQIKLYEELKYSLSLLQNLKFLRLEVSRNYIFVVLEAINKEKCFRNLLSLEIIENPVEWNNQMVLDQQHIKLLFPLAKQLVSLNLRIEAKFERFNEAILAQFKYLTTFSLDESNFHFPTVLEFINQHRKPLVFVAWVLKNKLRKAGGIFIRNQVLEEILKLFINRNQKLSSRLLFFPISN